MVLADALKAFFRKGGPLRKGDMLIDYDAYEPDTEGFGGAGLDWEELDKQIDEFCKKWESKE